ncbi:MAG: molybdenum cofactor guanylyltransferase [Sphingosinicella sp.]|uniref:molybdenum cofactor guanylyltransferase n=1 Tax=Sphingosinicella sp. TaxID=1917971 RepID=UPI004037BF8D
MSTGLLVAVLAGGEGRRIGGGKPSRLLGGETLLARALRLARGWSDEVRTVVRDPGQAAGAPLLLDDAAIAGPLGGLAAALRFARSHGHEAVLTLPCDMPFAPPDLPGRLGTAIEARAAAIAASGGEIHPVCAMWRRDVLDRLDAYLATGRRSLRGFAETVGFIEVDWSVGSLDPFFNINSAQDLRRAEAMLLR